MTFILMVLQYFWFLALCWCVSFSVIALQCMSRQTLLAGTAMLRMDTDKSDATLDAEIED